MIREIGHWVIRERGRELKVSGLKLNEERFGHGYPLGDSAEARWGYSFFFRPEGAKKEDLENGGYITSRISDQPESNIVLEAVSKRQFDYWNKGFELYAKRAIFTWSQVQVMNSNIN